MRRTRLEVVRTRLDGISERFGVVVHREQRPSKTPVRLVKDGSTIGRRADWAGMSEWLRKYPEDTRVIRESDGEELAVRCHQLFIPDIDKEFGWLFKERAA